MIVLVPAAAYLAWKVEAAWLLSAALVLSPIAGNWPELGIPGPAAPDRLLLLAGIAPVLLRPTAFTGGQPLRFAPVHWLMLGAVVFVGVSALAADTLTQSDWYAQLFDTFGVTPFAVFLVAPLAFRHRYQRDILLGSFVVLGAYLGLTAIFERANLDALVFPKYILDPEYGIHPDRARGPFVEAVTNGFALFMCAVAAAIANKQWQGERRADLAGVVILLCIAGAILTMQRSVWLAAAAAMLVTALTLAGERRRAIKGIVAIVVAVGLALLLVPGFYDDVAARFDDDKTVHDRENLAHAAVGMIEDKPLLGFGWGQFVPNAPPYFEQAADYNLGDIAGVELHNSVLVYAVELGLLGAGLWVLILVMGVGAGLSRRGPPDLDDWRVGLLAIAVAYAVIVNFVPPQAFPNLALWTWAGIGWVGFQGPAR